MRLWLYLTLCAGGALSIAVGLGLLARLVTGVPAYGAEPGGCVLTRATGHPTIVRASDRTDLARTIWAESRGEPKPCGQVAVGFVAVNRMTSKPGVWGSTISRVVRQPGQFTVWRKAKRLERLTERDAGYTDALRAADMVLSGAVADPTHGATFFVSTGIALPRWARGMARQRIGNHVFLKARQ